MENAYGIGITNRFGCFLRRASSDSEDENDEVLMKSSDKPKPKIAEKENQTQKVDGSAKLDKTNAAARKGIRDSNQKGNDSAKGQTGGVGGNRTITTNNESGQQKQNRPPRTDRAPFDKERGMNKFSEDDREERNNRRNRDDGNR